MDPRYGVRRLSLPKTEADTRVLVTDLISKIELLGRIGPKLAAEIPPEVGERLLRAIHVAQSSLEGILPAGQRAISRGPDAAVQKICTDVGVFAALARRKEASFTTEALKTLTLPSIDVDLFRRILSYAATHGLIDEVRSGNWQANARTQAYAHPANASAIRHSFACLDPVWATLPEALKANDYRSPVTSGDTPFQFTYGQGVTHSEWLKRNPEILNHWVRAMSLHGEVAESWIGEEEDDEGDDSPEIIDFEEILSGSDERKVFVDIAGGVGRDCANLVAAYPSAAGKVVLQDQADVIALATGQVSKMAGSPLEGVEMMAVDMFDGQPIIGARLYHLKNTLQHYDNNQCVVILSHIVDAMSSDSRVIIDEMLVPGGRGDRSDEDFNSAKSSSGSTTAYWNPGSAVAAQVDLTMMLFGGMLRSGEQWIELLESVGLKVEAVRRYGADEGVNASVIIARKG